MSRNQRIQQLHPKLRQQRIELAQRLQRSHTPWGCGVGLSAFALGFLSQRAELSLFGTAIPLLRLAMASFNPAAD